eukprot:356347-Chlamydomonas_euryale.AAC.9
MRQRRGRVPYMRLAGYATPEPEKQQPRSAPSSGAAQRQQPPSDHPHPVEAAPSKLIALVLP